MAELLDFCLKLEAMFVAKPTNGCDKNWCLGTDHRWPKCPNCGSAWDEVRQCRTIPMEPPDPSLVLILADWLEERGDPRTQMLREMEIVEASYKQIREAGMTHKLLVGGTPVAGFSSQADAARELIRRAFELMTMPCPYADSLAMDDCPICGDRGWVPAKAEAKLCNRRPAI